MPGGLVPSREAGAAVLAAFALIFAALYPAATPDPGAWGAWRPLGPDERVLACGVLGGEPAFASTVPFRVRVDTPSWSVLLRLPSMDACVGGGLAALAGSLGGQPAVALVHSDGSVEAYTVPAFGNAVSVSCGYGRVAFTAATFTGDLVLGVVEPGRGGWAWLIPGAEGAWTSTAAAAPWGIVAVAGGVLYNASPAGVVSYSLPDPPGFNVTWRGVSWGPGGVVVYGSAEGEGWAAAVAASLEGWGVAVNTSRHGGYFRAAYPDGAGLRAYYSPASWWDALAFTPWRGWGVYGLRVVQGYPHTVASVSVGLEGFTIASIDAEGDRAVCLLVPNLTPAVIGDPGDELAVVKPIPAPDRLKAAPLNLKFHGPAPARAEPLEVAEASVEAEAGGPVGNWTMKHSGVDEPGEALLGLALALPPAAASYYALGLDRLPSAARGKRLRGEGRG